MDIYELINMRQSDREFDTSHQVESEKLQRIIEAAHLAPSACNAQPWHLIVVNNPEKCCQVAETLTSMGMNKFANQATAHIIIVEEAPNFTSRLGGWVKNKHFPLIDCGIIASLITLLATQEGLGCCILGWFDEKKLKKVLNVPSRKRVLLDIALGYSIQPHRNKVRKPLNEVASLNEY